MLKVKVDNQVFTMVNFPFQIFRQEYIFLLSQLIIKLKLKK